MHSSSHSPTPRLFWYLLTGATCAALIPTIWPGVDLQLAGLFAGESPAIHSVHWWWVSAINQYVPAAFRVLLGLCFVAWVFVTLQPRWRAWRLPLAFVVIAGIMGPGLVVNAVFKDNWQRARPYQVTEFGGSKEFTRAGVITNQCEENCSFVSGHVACGVFFSGMLLVLPHRRRLWAVTGTLAGGIVGFARMSDVAHWFSDVLWAYPITLVTSWLVWQGLRKAYRWYDARTSGT